MSTLWTIGLADSTCAQNSAFTHDGLQRQYRLHLPEALPESAPLVLVLHGYGGSNTGMFTGYGWTELADERGFAVACPNGTRDQWNSRFWNVGYEFHQPSDIDDDGFLVALAQYLQETHGLDPERTFVTGFSNGADMCFQLACREPETFKGFAPIAGTMLDSLFYDCDPAVLRPILSMSGDADPITLFNGDPNNFDGWGAYRSIPEVISLWSELLQTPFVNTATLPDLDPTDGSRVELSQYTGSNRPTLRYYRILGGGHDWPGQSGNMDVDATLEAWTFFEGIPPEVEPSPADFTLDGTVDALDLAVLLSAWGPTNPEGDLNGDGATNAQDLSALLAMWSG